ncbi:MAG: hypothetical protein PHC80_02660 [Eubacteriales bacterium]|nr:hypothetical protein [Eubacteriales bacterium]
MIHVLCGETGTGKSKKIIDMANASIKDAKGTIVFIASGNQYMYDLKRDIRHIDADEYHIEGPKMFFGFLSGIAAQDFDLEYLYIDNFLSIVQHPLDSLEGLFKDMEDFSKRANIKLFISASSDTAETPAFLLPYMA